MHIPSGFLEARVWLPMGAIAAAGAGYAIRRTGRELDEKRTPVMGVMAAFVFAAQMVNFPVLGGTSGHLMGSALMVAVLGTWPATVAMTAVVIMQALLFQDGGIEALGANVFNMAVLGCIVSGSVLAAGRRFGGGLRSLPLALAGWLSVVAASAFCALELALSGTSPIGIVLPAMTAVHGVIGVFEGLITVVAFRFICSVNPRIAATGKGGAGCGGL